MKKNKKFKVYFLLSIIFLFAYACSPGTHMQTYTSWTDESSRSYVPGYTNNYPYKIYVYDIKNSTKQDEHEYLIGIGDQLSVVVWGLEEAFPTKTVSPDLNLRTVHTDGNIYFPYVGYIQAANLTQNQVRNDLSIKLSKYFNDPQLDVTIARYNSQHIYVMGEVLKPSKIPFTETPITLTDALGSVNGMNNATSDGAGVFIIRKETSDSNPSIYIADLSTPASFIHASNFYLKSGDVIYVNASGIARWNRIIAQFFPFSTFINAVDNIANN